MKNFIHEKAKISVNVVETRKYDVVVEEIEIGRASV